MKQQTLTNVSPKSASKTNEFHLFTTFGRHGGLFRTSGVGTHLSELLLPSGETNTV